jgi:NAD(P)-dependent dehydrogenase (short-subunit alcohol dehydrogenase family)
MRPLARQGVADNLDGLDLQGRGRPSRRILSAELVDRGIRVNTLSPGPTDTAMFGRVPGEEQGEAVKDVLRTNNPSKRMADPLEIAKLAVYPRRRFCTLSGRLPDRRRVTAISVVGA